MFGNDNFKNTSYLLSDGYPRWWLTSRHVGNSYNLFVLWTSWL